MFNLVNNFGITSPYLPRFLALSYCKSGCVWGDTRSFNYAVYNILLGKRKGPVSGALFMLRSQSTCFSDRIETPASKVLFDWLVFSTLIKQGLGRDFGQHLSELRRISATGYKVTPLYGWIAAYRLSVVIRHALPERRLRYIFPAHHRRKSKSPIEFLFGLACRLEWKTGGKQLTICRFIHLLQVFGSFPILKDLFCFVALKRLEGTVGLCFKLCMMLSRRSQNEKIYRAHPQFCEIRFAVWEDLPRCAPNEGQHSTNALRQNAFAPRAHIGPLPLRYVSGLLHLFCLLSCAPLVFSTRMLSWL